MSKSKIKRRNLCGKLDRIKQNDWVIATPKLRVPSNPSLNLIIRKGGKHPYVIRDPRYPEDTTKNLIATIQSNLYKEANEYIFKHLLDFGISEDDIWKALKIKIK